MRIPVFLLMALFLVDAEAKDLPVSEKLVQRTNVELNTHIGGQIFKVTRTSPLPNAFGRRDIFGRKVDRGFMELRYMGKTQDGFSKFRLRDIETSSNETTMSRTKVSIVNGNNTQTFNAYNNSITNRSSAMIIRSPEGKTEDLPPNTTDFELDTTTSKEIEFGSVRLIVIEAEPVKLIYRLERL